MKTVSSHVSLIALLALMSTVTPLAIDAYLPSMPDIASSLNVGIEKIEVSISVFLLFFAFGQLLGGVLSDRVGRKFTALLGLFLFSVSSFILFFTQSLEFLYIFRAFQAFFGAMAVVNTAAIVRVLFHGKEAAKVFSTIASIMMIAPMIAPALGSLIITFYTWNYIFLFLAVYSLFVFFLILLKLPKTGTKSNTKIIEAFKKVLGHKKALSYILSVSFAFAGMFIFIEKSSFIYMEYFAISKEYFPIFFGANVLMMIIFTRINVKLIHNNEPSDILKYGVILQLIAGILLCLLAFSPSLILVFICMILYIGSLGFIFGNAMACALEFFKKDTGVANSVIGVIEFLIAGIIGFIASSIHTGTLMPVFIMMTLTALCAYLSLKLIR